MRAPGPRWSIILCYYNERGFITETLRSAVAQVGTSFRLVLVDNRSDDGTTDLCRTFLADYPAIDVRYVEEARPGHAFAVAAGFAAADTDLIAFWDADTRYPPHYLAEAERLLRPGPHRLAQAIDVYDPPESREGQVRRTRMALTQRLLGRQGHTGFFGICAWRSTLEKAGGPMNADWPYVLEDHELLQRLFKHASTAVSRDLWCQPAPRRTANAHVRWTLLERVLYHLTPFALKDWYFYRFLARRFARRGMVQANLRVRDWDDRSHSETE